MCGIAGIVGPRATSSALEVALRSMQAALNHRGPDDSGLFVSDDGRCGLAHTRLSILDLSPAGHQPMGISEHGAKGKEHRAESREQRVTTSGHERYWITFNGEIYNFRALRDRLSADGVVFSSNSDTEVILRLYERYGVDCVKHLRGMFAFGIWDDFEKTCLLARGPMGIKPLYYAERNRTLVFASELRALLSSNHVANELCPAGMTGYFRTGSVPEPFTLIDGVRCFEAGTYLLWREGNSERKTYWTWPEPSSTLCGQAAVASLRKALLDSVQHHFVSDVPVGIFLSGGIDSTALVALAREAGFKHIQTFCVAVDDPELDESDVARRTAGHFGTEHHELKLDGATGKAWFAEYLKALDQPSIDGFNTYCVSRVAHEHRLKVVLSGLGGDEIFGSYPSFRQVPKLMRFAGMLEAAHPVKSAIARYLVGQKRSGRLRRVGDFLQQNPSITSAYTTYRGIFTREEARILTQSILPTVAAGRAVEEIPDEMAERLGDAEAVSYLEVTRYMRNQLLRDSDVMSMAFGLELRVPFLDVPLVETALRVPARERLAAGKRFLLAAVPEIPEWVASRPKRGFVFPFQRWLGEEWKQRLGDVSVPRHVLAQSWYQQWSIFVLKHWLARITTRQLMEVPK